MTSSSAPSVVVAVPPMTTAVASLGYMVRRFVDVAHLLCDTTPVSTVMVSPLHVIPNPATSEQSKSRTPLLKMTPLPEYPVSALPPSVKEVAETSPEEVMLPVLRDVEKRLVEEAVVE